MREDNARELTPSQLALSSSALKNWQREIKTGESEASLNPHWQLSKATKARFSCEPGVCPFPRTCTERLSK
jgi:hypothetical protein